MENISILIDGIASIYVDNEYLEYSDIGTKYKQKIIQELLSFFKYLTKFSKEKVFMIYTREVKKYRMKEFNWDSIPYQYFKSHRIDCGVKERLTINCQQDI